MKTQAEMIEKGKKGLNLNATIPAMNEMANVIMSPT
jgi:hypothetical protein